MGLIASYIQSVGIIVFLVQCILHSYKVFYLYVLNYEPFYGCMRFMNFPKNNSGVKGIIIGCCSTVHNNFAPGLLNIFKPGTHHRQAGTHLVSYNHFHSAKICVYMHMCVCP